MDYFTACLPVEIIVSIFHLVPYYENWKKLLENGYFRRRFDNSVFWKQIYFANISNIEGIDVLDERVSIQYARNIIDSVNIDSIKNRYIWFMDLIKYHADEGEYDAGLHLAACYGSIKYVRHFLELGADIITRECFYVAGMHGDIELIKKLRNLRDRSVVKITTHEKREHLFFGDKVVHLKYNSSDDIELAMKLSKFDEKYSFLGLDEEINRLGYTPSIVYEIINHPEGSSPLKYDESNWLKYAPIFDYAVMGIADAPQNISSEEKKIIILEMLKDQNAGFFDYVLIRSAERGNIILLQKVLTWIPDCMDELISHISLLGLSPVVFPTTDRSSNNDFYRSDSVIRAIIRAIANNHFECVNLILQRIPDEHRSKLLPKIYTKWYYL